MEQTDGIGAAAHTGNGNVRLAADGFQHLFFGFIADHALEIAYHFRIRRRAGGSADDVERIVHTRHPFAHGFVHRVFQSTAAAVNADHVRTQ